MNTYERLQDEACEDGVEVVDYPFENERIKGLYCDGIIAIRNTIDTTTEKACVLAEELGHHHTSVGNILDLEDISSRKQECKARLWAYNSQIGLRGLIDAYEHGCQNPHEIAEFLEVTTEFLVDCVEYYRNKYGIGVALDGYYITFIPYLTVLKKM